MSTLYISQYRLVEVAHVKPHYVYVVDIFHSGKKYSVEKRYSAFHSLHRELRAHYQTPVFPPKRVRNTQPKVLEQRRLGLEQYLQQMLKSAATRKKILSFFGLNLSQEQEDIYLTDDVSDEEIDELGKPVNHEPIFKHKQDTYLEIETNKFNDTLSASVLSVFYGDRL
ncbi:sorting nexin-24-like [Neocloeon triangulifer]|uniref:sorting nexin-24-like n=1 Tax=Neocloeon triangulifer TaxID=2078957 RepID=UPI00286EDECC|nr:sorting nexin-24-like [Neocloeon triangulifer]